MIVCHCRVVTDRQIADVVRQGAVSLGSVCRSTGAGQQCGSCIFSVRRVLCDHQAKGQAPASAPDQGHPAPAIGVQVAAS